MADINANNPAGRLFLLLNKAKTIHIPNAQTATISQQMKAAWDIPNGDALAMTYFVANVWESLVEIEEQLKVADTEEYEIFKDTSDHLRRNFLQAPNLQNNWWQFVSGFRDIDLSRLQYASKTLSRSHPEVIIPSADLEEIRQQLHDLYAEIENAKLDFRLRVFLLEGIHNLETAIRDYMIRGTKSVEKAVETILGTGLLHPEMAGTAKTETEKGTLVQFGKIIAKTILALKLAHSTLELLTGGADHKRLPEYIDAPLIEILDAATSDGTEEAESTSTRPLIEAGPSDSIG